MEPESVNGSPSECHNPVSASRKTPLKETPGTPGLLKRFLGWLTRGAEESNMGGRACPT
jgi:hypothetical protein